MRLDAKLFRISTSVVLIAATIIPLFLSNDTYAAQITNRTLTLQDGATDGASKPGGVVKHLFSFTIPTSGTIGSIKFQYCMIAVGTCDMPADLVTTAATLTNETGVTGFTMVNATNGSPYLTRGAASGSGAVSYQLSNITNPSTTNQSFFVRITTYTATNATGTPVDSGVVTASTATQIELTGIMPESIIFCTGATVGTTSGLPDCSKASAGVVDFNQLFSPSDTATATSQMSASTNSTNGYVIKVFGTTLTSGSNTIPAMTSSAFGVRGTGQFGMNLVLNSVATSTVAVGADIAPVSNGTDLRANPTVDYGTIDKFKFVSSDTIANSDNGGAGPTNSQIYTASYIVNVAGSQVAGTYTTTLTYVCTATF